MSWSNKKVKKEANGFKFMSEEDVKQIIDKYKEEE